MRDYLYLWHQPHTNRLIASGIEFRDLVPELAPAGGVVLLRHGFDEPYFDPASHFDFLPADRLKQLAADDIHGYGDFRWADFARGVALTDLTDPDIAALAFFAHAGRPLDAIEVPRLGNSFLYWGHDDGWYARIFYTHWDTIAPMLNRVLTGVLGHAKASSTSNLIRRGDAAYWCARGVVAECDQTEDIDALQQKYLSRG